MVVFREIGGVPVHYDRDAGAYGTRGRPVSLRCGATFKRKLDVCFTEVWGLTERAEVVTCAGAFVSKKGMHGQGRALDLDGIFWRGASFVARRAGLEWGNRRGYYGLEAVLRKHFGTVLDFWFDAEHRDHLHLDDGTGVGFRRGARSQVLFVQAVLNEFHDAGLRIDGVFGPLSRAALQEVAGDVTAPAAWLAFLDRIARLGLAHDA